MRSVAWLVSVVLLAGCSFDARVPQGVQVSCDANTPCPAGSFCQLTLGRCVSNDNSDNQSPRVLSARFSRSRLARGSTLTLELEVDEPLGLAPRVAIAELGLSADMMLTGEVAGEQPRYAFSYTVGATDVEGPASVFADLVDTVGNASSAVLIGGVTLDFTPPTPTGLTFVAPRASDGGVVEVRPDEVVQVRLTMSEPVAAGSRLTAVPTDCDGGVIAALLASNEGGLLDFSLEAPAGLAACRYALHLSAATDLAGNAQAPADIVVGSPYLLDDEAPAIGELATYRPSDAGWTGANAFSRQAGFDLVGVQFRLGPSTVAMSAAFDDALIAGCDLGSCPSDAAGERLCTCARSVDASDTEGVHAVLVTARDVAGNSRFASVPVTLDFSPPYLVSSGASPALAKLGDDVVYSLTPSERLVDTPLVSVSGPGSFDLAFLGATYAYHRRTSSLDTDGTYQVAVTMTDLVGNSATALPGASFEIDVSRPTITAFVPAAPRYSAVAGYDEVVVDVTIAERVDLPGASLLVTLDGRVMSCGPYSATPPNYSCRYVVSGTEPEGTVLLQALATDAAGNGAFASSSVTLDFTPPALGSKSVSYVRPAGCSLGEVGAATIGTTASERFSVSELLVADPAVTATTGSWSIARNAANSAGLFYEYELVLTSADAGSQGAFSPQVVLTDLVGNTSAPLALAEVTIDTVPPGPPAVNTPGAIVYQRVPWGFDEDRSGTVSPRTFRLIGSPGALVGDATHAFAYDGPNLATALEIGNIAAVDGGFGTMALNRSDRTDVYLAGLDLACNASPAVRVRDVSWTATLGFKVPGSTFENPLVWTTAPMFANTLVQDATSSTEPNSAQLARLQSVDGQALVRAAEGSWLARGTANSTARYELAMAYDSLRGKVVAFGGWASIGTPRGDTWEWDPATGAWTDRTPAYGPPARARSAMAFDAARGKVVLFGGNGSSVMFGDTWEWDGATGTWSQRASGPSPSARQYHAMAYDSTRGRVLLFGGNGSSFVNQQDIWEWDGASGTWTDRTTTAIKPAPRQQHAVAYDPVRRRLVLFGGNSTAGHLEDTWEWDGATGLWSWRYIPAGFAPPARSGHGMAYDQVRGQVVMFGGYGATGVLQDVWEWGAGWTQRSLVTRPPARYGHGLVFDSARGKLVAFGGAVQVPEFAPRADTWEWAPGQASWIDRTPTSAGPSGRSAHAMAYDGVRQKVVLFGGNGLQDTWEWDGAGGGWANRTPSTGNPPGRREHALAYDSARGVTVLFGGRASGAFQDTWEWNGATGTWTERTSTTLNPLARSGHAMVYDAARGKVVLFGGQASSGDQQDTWEWDGVTSTWTDRTPTTGSPSARKGHAMSYDAARGRVLLFGGVGGAARLQDTWEWDGSLGTWTEVSPSSSPTARYGHAMAYDGARARTLLFGGSAAGSFLQDAWAWDGTSRSWTNVSSTVLPRQRFQAAMAWDAAAARVVLFGGFGGGSPGDLADTWEWNGGPLEAPGQLLQVPLGATGSTAEWTVQSISARARAGGTGYPAGSATHGAELLLWDQGAWRVMATNADAASGPNELQWSTSTPSVLQPLLQAQRLHFALKPTAPSGTGPGTVAVDYAEVTVRYRLP